MRIKEQDTRLNLHEHDDDDDDDDDDDNDDADADDVCTVHVFGVSTATRANDTEIFGLCILQSFFVRNMYQETLVDICLSLMYTSK